MDPKVARCLLIAKVLVADGIMTENERVFLDKAMSGMGLDAAEKRKVFDLEGWDQAEAADQQERSERTEAIQESLHRALTP